MKQITEDYCSFEIAKLLKEKGFDWPQSPFYSEQDMDEWMQENSYIVQNPDYNPDIPFDSETITMVAPHISQSLALKWLREVKKIHISLYAVSDLPEEGYIPEKITYTYNILDAKEPFHFFDDYDDIINPPQFNSYEQAVEAVLLYILKNLI